MVSWSLLTTHAQTLLYVAGHPNARLRDIAIGVGITERTATAIVKDLAEAGYVVKHRDGRRNRYEIRPDVPLHDFVDERPTIGQLIHALTDVESAAGGQADR